MDPKWSDVNTVRKAFVDFFVEKAGHDHIVSSPVIPHDDPTLLFINAGMNQFKSIFVGTVDPNSAFGKLKRAANSQKCIRAGGKHNDLEDVGKDSYHHTFFEMLGNWSFGDYFKTEAIDWAWELLTKVYGLDPDRIYVTYFGGDERAPTVPIDTEARDMWRKYLPADRILPYGCKENFWEMGETGPCGPCSEIHYDRIGGRFVPELVNADDPTLVEIWNLVFMQFNRETDRSLTPLPFGSVDTGMGMERLASILIDRPSNYDIAGFQHIFKAIQANIPNLADRPYLGLEGAADVEGIDMAYRVVADHIRTLSISIADGALPSNDGRGYVLRRILRRAVRYGKQKLGAPSKPWFKNLVTSVVETLGETYPTLVEKKEHIISVIESEERQFTSTLERGLREFDRVLQATKAEGKTVFPGGEPGAFTLFTTYGFPLDLTQLMVEEQGMTLDLAAYEAQFEEHRRKAREGGKKTAVFEFKLQQEQLHILANEFKAPYADTTSVYEWTPGAGNGPSKQAKVLAILTEKDGFQPSIVSDDQIVGVVLDATNFYAEAGGQVADIGAISGAATEDDFQGAVEDVQRFGTYICHTVRLTNGTISVGQEVTLTPDFERRAATGKNHTGTHVLNFALRKVLGDDVEQKGSLVDAQRLRFDFSYNGVVPVECLAEIEKIVNEEIANKRTVYAKAVALEEAQKIPGLRFMKGEQYPNPVRVLSLASDPSEMALDGFTGTDGFAASVEFCGGTHMANSSEIGSLVIMSEEGVAKGIRRLVGYTGAAAVDAKLRATTLRAEFKKISAITNETELDAKLSTFRGVLDADSTLPYLDKKALLAEADAVKARLLESAKKRAAEMLVVVKAKAKTFAAELGTASAVLDLSVEAAGDSKATDQAAKVVETEAAGKPFIVISGAAGGSATVIVVGSETVDAKAVLEKVNVALGGRGGGKAARAIGSAKDITAENLEAALKVAQEIAATF